jgi:hypothetical protein
MSQAQLTIEIKFTAMKPERCISIVKGSGVALQGMYEDQLAYIRTHADRLGISHSQIEAIRTLCDLPVASGDPAPTGPQELSQCGNLDSCTQLHMERMP